MTGARARYLLVFSVCVALACARPPIVDPHRTAEVSPGGFAVSETDGGSSLREQLPAWAKAYVQGAHFECRGRKPAFGLKEQVLGRRWDVAGDLQAAANHADRLCDSLTTNALVFAGKGEVSAYGYAWDVDNAVNYFRRMDGLAELPLVGCRGLKAPTEARVLERFFYVKDRSQMVNLAREVCATILSAKSTAETRLLTVLGAGPDSGVIDVSAPASELDDVCRFMRARGEDLWCRTRDDPDDPFDGGAAPSPGPPP